MLSRSTFVGESEVPTTGALQQTLEPGAKSTDGLISTSYLAAPAIGSQEKWGSKTSVAVIRASTRVTVLVGQVHMNDCTGEGAPRWPCASIGVTFQSPSLDPKLSVGENLKFHGWLYGLTGAALASRIGELL